MNTRADATVFYCLYNTLLALASKVSENKSSYAGVVITTKHIVYNLSVHWFTVVEIVHTFNSGY